MREVAIRRLSRLGALMEMAVGLEVGLWRCGLCVPEKPVTPLRPPTFRRSFICVPHSQSSGSMSSSSSNPNVSFSQFQDVFDAALREYRQKTGKDIVTEPLTMRLLHCDSSDSVLGILQEQARVFNQFRNGDWKIQLMRRLKPTVDILLGLSTGGVFGEGFGLVRLINSIYGIAKAHHLPRRDYHQRRQYLPVLVSYSQYVSIFLLACTYSLDTQILKAAKGVSTSYDALIELFECFGHYLGRLKVLTEIPSAVGEILVKIMVELLGVLALAMQQIKQGRFSESCLVVHLT
jgi:hypothetical protein